MPLIASIAYFVVMIFIVTLFIRLVFDWIQVFSRDWRPKGLMLLIAEAVYTVTDPPLKLLRKVIPPLRIGNVALDLAFLFLIFGYSFMLIVLFMVVSIKFVRLYAIRY